MNFVKLKPVVLVERFNFNQLMQRRDETISAWLARVKRGAEHCNYGGFYAEAIRDRFVIGFLDGNTQKFLLTESDLTVETAHTCSATSRSSTYESVDT